MSGEKILSVTEMGVFLQCRMKWFLTSPSGEGLQYKGFPAMPLVLGTLVHAGLSAHALHQDWMQAVQESAGEYIARAEHDRDTEVIEKAVTECCAWITDYITMYGDEPFSPLRVVASEQSFTLDIAGTLDDNYAPLGTLVGTFDYVLEDVKGGIYIADTKTYSPQNKPSHEKYLLDLQFNTYAWVCREIFGRCDGILYDGIEKKHPARFERFLLRPDEMMMQSTARQVRQTFREAFAVDFAPLRLFGYECSRCPVRDLCFTDFCGEDMLYLAEQKYERGAKGSRSRDAVSRRQAAPVSSLAELRTLDS